MNMIHMENGASYEGPKNPEKERLIRMAVRAIKRTAAGWKPSWGSMPGEGELEPGERHFDFDGQEHDG